MEGESSPWGKGFQKVETIESVLRKKEKKGHRSRESAMLKTLIKEEEMGAPIRKGEHQEGIGLPKTEGN